MMEQEDFYHGFDRRKEDKHFSRLESQFKSMHEENKHMFDRILNMLNPLDGKGGLVFEIQELKNKTEQNTRDIKDHITSHWKFVTLIISLVGVIIALIKAF